LVIVSLMSLVGLIADPSSAAANQHENHHKGKENNGEQHSQHHAEMNQRGDKAMGFGHLKTTHHFRLFKDGGAIEVTANETSDKDSTEQIREHLSHISVLFSDGNFSIPMLVHNELPDGAKTMAAMKGEITYQFEEKERGGQVRITGKNREAISAIHQFLRYQIKEHKTGDTMEITNP
jgi:hypothetical protein